MTTVTKTKQVLKKGMMRFYFPEFPNHEFNGMFAHGNGKDFLWTFEDSYHNRTSSSGYWENEIKITAKDFGVEKLIVKRWYHPDFDRMPEYHILTQNNIREVTDEQEYNELRKKYRNI